MLLELKRMQEYSIISLYQNQIASELLMPDGESKKNTTLSSWDGWILELILHTQLQQKQMWLSQHWIKVLAKQRNLTHMVLKELLIGKHHHGKMLILRL